MVGRIALIEPQNDHLRIFSKFGLPRLGSVLPLPGMGLSRSLRGEGRILDHQRGTHDGHHVRFRPSGFSQWGQRNAQIDAHARFHSPFQVFLRLIRGRLQGFLIGVYANALSGRWKRIEAAHIHSLKTVPAG